MVPSKCQSSPILCQLRTLLNSQICRGASCSFSPKSSLAAPPSPNCAHHLRTCSIAAITFLMSSFALLLVSARMARPDMRSEVWRVGKLRWMDGEERGDNRELSLRTVSSELGCSFVLFIPFLSLFLPLMGFSAPSLFFCSPRCWEDSECTSLCYSSIKCCPPPASVVPSINLPPSVYSSCFFPLVF